MKREGSALRTRPPGGGRITREGGPVWGGEVRLRAVRTELHQEEGRSQRDAGRGMGRPYKAQDAFFHKAKALGYVARSAFKVRHEPRACPWWGTLPLPWREAACAQDVACEEQAPHSSTAESSLSLWPLLRAPPALLLRASCASSHAAAGDSAALPRPAPRIPSAGPGLCPGGMDAGETQGCSPWARGRLLTNGTRCASASWCGHGALCDVRSSSLPWLFLTGGMPIHRTPFRRWLCCGGRLEGQSGYSHHSITAKPLSVLCLG